MDILSMSAPQGNPDSGSSTCFPDRRLIAYDIAIEESKTRREQICLSLINISRRV